jgi:hypothetical protein
MACTQRATAATWTWCWLAHDMHTASDWSQTDLLLAGTWHAQRATIAARTWCWLAHGMHTASDQGDMDLMLAGTWHAHSERHEPGAGRHMACSEQAARVTRTLVLAGTWHGHSERPEPQRPTVGLHMACTQRATGATRTWCWLAHGMHTVSNQSDTDQVLAGT